MLKEKMVLVRVEYNEQFCSANCNFLFDEFDLCCLFEMGIIYNKDKSYYNRCIKCIKEFENGENKNKE